MTGVVGIVAAMPCRGMGITASVISRVRPPCVGSLAPRWGLGRGGVCARAQEGSGETELTPEAKGSGEAEPVPEPWRFWVFYFYSPFLYFLFLSFGYPFLWYPRVAPEPLEG